METKEARALVEEALSECLHVREFRLAKPEDMPETQTARDDGSFYVEMGFKSAAFPDNDPFVMTILSPKLVAKITQDAAQKDSRASVVSFARESMRMAIMSRLAKMAGVDAGDVEEDMIKLGATIW